uniref:Uncharacterized protein n=1 Tax=Dunaliella tertiolecta TaxID=3047 RepID=A0A7S3VM98_DUNTE
MFSIADCIHLCAGSNAVSKQPIVFHRQIKSSGYGFVQPPVKLGRPPPPPVKLPARPIPTSNVTRHLLQARSYPMKCDPPLIPQERNCLPNQATAHHGAITRLRYSSDASRLLTVSTDKTARVMPLPLSKFQGEGTDLLGHNAGLLAGDWSMDGTLVLTSSADRSARLWNAGCAHPLMHLSHSLHSPSFDANPNSSSSNGTPAATPSRPPFSPSAASNSPFLHEVTGARFYYQDQFVLLSCGNRLNLYRYKLADGDMNDDIARFKASSKYRLAACHHTSAQTINDFTASNSFLSPIALLAGSNRCIEVVDCSTMQAVGSMPDAHARPVHTIVQSANASLYTSHPREASELFATMACDGALKLWDLRVCRCVRTFGGHQNSQITVGAAFSPCFRFLACGSEDQAAYLYDIRQGTVLSRLGRHGSAVTDVAFNPLHPQLAVASQGGHVHFYSDDGY